MAIESGFLTEEQLQEGLRIQKKLTQMGLKEGLGDILVKKQMLTAQNVRDILKTQGEESAEQIPGYKIISKLGAGAMGNVYKARQKSMDRNVAIKILSKEWSVKKDARDRFLREGKMAARLNHPNVVAAYDVGTAGTYHFLIMEFVDGPTLQQLLKRGGALDEEEALDYFLQCARALEHAHKHEVVHRDVKPANILIDQEGRARLADLGLARPTSKQPGAQATSAVMGTPSTSLRSRLAAGLIWTVEPMSTAWGRRSTTRSPGDRSSMAPPARSSWPST